MVKLTMIARVIDGLPLAEGLDDGRDMQDAEFYKQQVKALFKNLSRGQNEASRMSVETGPYIFHYIIEGRVCYLTMCDRAYPKKLAFQYLEDLKNEFERGYGNQIETAARPPSSKATEVAEELRRQEEEAKAKADEEAKAREDAEKKRAAAETQTRAENEAKARAEAEAKVREDRAAFQWATKEHQTSQIATEGVPEDIVEVASDTSSSSGDQHPISQTIKKMREKRQRTEPEGSHTSHTLPMRVVFLVFLASFSPQYCTKCL